MVNKVKKKMVKKKVVKRKVSHKKIKNKIKSKKVDYKKTPTLKLKTEQDIAMDFATKVYRKFNKMVKSIVLFGSVAKKESVVGSDIDIIILIDDATIMWDEKLIAWYREELEKIIRGNPYSKNLHINTIKLTTWWEDLLRGDPTIMNMIRYGETMIDFAGFFDPLKRLLIQGRMRSTPEAIYSCLQRAPIHITRSRVAELSAIEGLYWSMVDSAHAALISSGKIPASPEHIAMDLKEVFVSSGKLKMKYVLWFRDLLALHKEISHGKISNLKGAEIDSWQDRAEEFLGVMVGLVKERI